MPPMGCVEAGSREARHAENANGQSLLSNLDDIVDDEKKCGKNVMRENANQSAKESSLDSNLSLLQRIRGHLLHWEFLIMFLTVARKQETTFHLSPTRYLIEFARCSYGRFYSHSTISTNEKS